MKIIKLRFKNLNSLAGEWSIDFSAPEYTSDGIFAISGPTGAGKSTILDAICLALYGCTPRLENISSTTNEIMSRQTGECFAEVVFETMEGRFRSNWSQRRARLNSEGLLQNPKHEISEAESGKILASQLKSTREMVEKKSGMDFRRFTQSMMLAQGGFAAFLQAKGSERAPILEQITGTEIYSKISVHVFERQKKEREILEILKAENSGIILLSPEEEQEQGVLLEEKNAKIRSLNTLKDQLVAAKTWIENIDKLKSELRIIAQEDILLTNQLNEFSGRRGILRDAVRAANLDGDHASLIALRNQQKEDTGVLENLQNQTPGLQAAISTETAAFEVVKKNNSDINKANAALLETIKLVRLLDQEIRQKSSSVEDIRKQISRLKSESEIENSKIKTCESAIKNLTERNEGAKRYLAEHSSDSVLVSELAVIRVKVSRLLELKNSLLTIERKVDTAKKSLKAQIEEISRISDEIIIANGKNTADKNAIDNVQSEINKSLDGDLPADLYERRDHLILHLAELRKISDLSSERSLLEDGKACPLCGSLSHPFATGNIPAISETELEYARLIGLLKSLEALNQKVTELKAQEKLSAEKISNLNTRHTLCLQQKLVIAESIEQGEEEIAECQSGLKERSENLLETLIPLGITVVPETAQGLKILIDSLEVRKDKWQQQEKLQKETGDKIIEKQNDINIIAAVIKTKKDSSDAKEVELSAAEKSLGSIRELRTEIFGEKNSDVEEVKSGKLLAEANEKFKKSEERIQEINQKLKDNLERIIELHNKTTARGKVLSLKEINFAELLEKDGFEDEKDYLSKKLSVNDREKLDAEAKNLDRKRTELDTRKRDREQKLELEEVKNLTAEKPEILSVQLSETAEALALMLQEVGAIKQRLLANNAAKAKGLALSAKINIQNDVFNRWAGLSSLIGSADGKKYRNFAQSLTLEIMVSYANNQLVKLSDRYLLTRDKDEPLELNVIDNYQAGEIRSTKNLSGGESFIVSLALALGLSRMSGRNVHVDSLFLDEGFGTLDEDALETALTTLAGLRQDGKMIGVISHVGAMKDRINTRIIVTPVREGRSVISGPGCTPFY